MNSVEIKQIRDIFIKKQDLKEFPLLHKKLFKAYFPHLEYIQYQHSDIWHCCVFGDYCGDLMGDIHPFKNEEECGFFNDIPGPVG